MCNGFNICKEDLPTTTSEQDEFEASLVEFAGRPTRIALGGTSIFPAQN